MAKRQVVSYSYTCDVCGDTIPDSDGDSANRKLSWEGTDYVVDVCSTHGSQLSDILAQLKDFVEAGQRSSGRRGRRPAISASASAPKASRPRKAAASASSSAPAASPKRTDLGAIRAWARDTGQKVSERGRIPGALLAAYDAAMSAPEAPAAAPTAAPVAAAARKRRPRKATAGAAS